MYAVIFRAKIKSFDEQYSKTAASLRDMAIEQYGCLEFTAVTEGDYEIAISYWPSEDAILRWRKDSAHIEAQHLGKEKWYESYSVEIMKLDRRYQYPR